MRGISKWIAAVAIAIAVAAGVDARDSAAPLQRPSDAVMARARHWADSVMATLTPRQRIEQLMVPRLDYKGDAAGLTAMRSFIRKHHVGGILLGKGTLAGYASLINEAQAASEVPLLVTLDGEWGLAMRVGDAPRFPYNMTLGAIRDPALLRDLGREIGRECRAVGINVDFAPVLDVNSNPKNPVIGFRSFGEDPKRVADLGIAFSLGLESEGVMSVAKHFPGHGNTESDSHKTLPKITTSRSQLEKTDIYPFKKYIDRHLGGVMVGHLDVPALDKSGRAASMSKKITTDYLKKHLHFGGLVFTDALAMKGAGLRGNNCVEAFIAGSDMLLQPADIDADIKAIEEAVGKGKIRRSEIDGRVRKVLVWKYLLGLERFKPADVAGIKAAVCTPATDALLQRLADAAATVLRNEGGLLPLSDLGHRRVAVAVIGEDKDCLFAQYCARYAPVDVVAAKGRLSESQKERLRNADVVVAAVFADSDDARASFRSMQSLDNLTGVFFINPYKMAKFEGVASIPALVAMYQNLPSLQVAAAEALFGGIAVSGRFPVNVEGVATIGAGVELAATRLGYASPAAAGFSDSLAIRLDSIALGGVEAGAMPGCQILVARGGNIVYEKAFGRIDTADDAAPVTTSTLFDLASVTKTHATLPGLMKAVDEGLVKLDDEIGKHIAQLDSTEKGAIRVEELLFHESGMPPVINVYRFAFDPATYEGPLLSASPKEPYTIKVGPREYGNSRAQLRRDIYSPREDDRFCYPVAEGIYTDCDGIDDFMRAVHNAPLRSKKYEYSCLNFILLKELQEAATGVDLDQWIDTEIYGPLGAWHTLYDPLTRFPADMIAATEDDRFLRRQKLHGYVHDEMAALSGGVQGNAGLFSNAADVAKLCQMWLNGGTYGGERILSEKTVRNFTRRHSRSARRALGFDLLSNYRTITTEKTSKDTFGHTGFTGTCYWVDPDNDLIIVFLSNRVDPSRDNRAWNSLNPRGAAVKAVYDSLL